MHNDHFSINNIPYGIASKDASQTPTVVTRIRDQVVFLDELVKAGHLSQLPSTTTNTFKQSTLNSLASLPKPSHITLRTALQSLLSTPSTLPPSCTANINSVTLHLPVYTRTFTDYLCSSAHIINAGRAMRGTSLPVPPSFLNLPIGYTGKASSLIVAGTDVIRPKGLLTGEGEEGEFVFGESRRLDYELEVGVVIGRDSARGESVESGEVEEYIFGLVLINDWSARDIQAVEMQPLGPHNGKSFATTVSPWVITTLALEPYTCSGPPRKSTVRYIPDDAVSKNTYNIHLRASVRTSAPGSETVVCESELAGMDWTLRDLVMQQTVNGCMIEVGDILGSGTVSGYGEGEGGCLLEINEGGKKGWSLKTGEKRVWLEDGDVVSLTGWAGEGVGFGECEGRVAPARKSKS